MIDDWDADDGDDCCSEDGSVGVVALFEVMWAFGCSCDAVVAGQC